MTPAGRSVSAFSMGPPIGERDVRFERDRPTPPDARAPNPRWGEGGRPSALLPRARSDLLEPLAADAEERLGRHLAALVLEHTHLALDHRVGRGVEGERA